jgi:histidine ammonia-lyase
VTAAALASECKVLAHPASVDTIPTDGSKEDVVPMAMAAAWKLRRVVHNVRHVLAIELMCAAQGLDYRKPLRPGAGVAHALRAVRALVAPLEGDRVLSTDIGVLAQAVAAGTFDDVAAAYVAHAGLAGSGVAIPDHGSPHRRPS